LKAQLEAVLSAHVRRHAPEQLTLWQGNLEQSNLHVLNASQVAVQLPWPQVKSQVLPTPQWHVLPAQSPLHAGLPSWQSTLQLPWPQVKAQELPPAQVHAPPAQSPVHVPLPPWQSTVQLPWPQVKPQLLL
jgi:hypothetical protein